MNYLRPLFSAVAALALMLGQPAHAENVVADLDRIERLLAEAGYEPKLTANAGEEFIAAYLDGYEFLILPYGCNESKRDCRSIQFFIAFDPPESPGLEAMNAYARENRWGRVYLDQDYDPALEFDLNLEKGGMSEELFLDNLAYWESAVVAYARFVFKKD